MKRAGQAELHAPPAGLPLAFIAAGLACLLAACAWLARRPETLLAHHYGPAALALTHLVVLGWILPVILGVLYQFVPVLLEARLHSVRLAWWHGALHAPGTVAMVWAFHAGRPVLLAVGGLAVTAGCGLALYNLGRTLLRAPRWRLVPAGLAAALGWLAVTLLAGLALAAAKLWPVPLASPLAAMHAHAHLGVLGAFVLLLVAVSYRLVPLFTVGEIQDPRRAAWSLGLLHAGTAAVGVTIFTGSPWKLAAGGVVTAGLILHAVELALIVRRARRRGLDPGLRCFLAALALLLPLAGLGLLLAWPGLPPAPTWVRLERVYGFLAFFGVLTPAILGLLFKIVSFLVWFARYRRRLGQPGVPAPADLYSPALQGTGCAVLHAGVLGTAAAMAFASPAGVRAGTVVILLAVALLLLNFARVGAHLVRPAAPAA